MAVATTSRNGRPSAKAKPTTKLIPAVAYLRKSTKGERPDGRQKQEKSLTQQRAEIKKLAGDRFEIKAWFEDEGVSGWKRGAKRPDFQQMLDEVKDLGAEAILCDNIDRFSRAEVDEVQEDAGQLRKAGVRWIVTNSHGEFDLGARSDIGAILKFVVAVWSANEYSRQLGRRITLAKRNAAAEGKRPAGRLPYAWLSDGNGGLKFGDPAKVKIVKWIFDQYANKGRSLNWIAEQLNTVKQVPAPKGKVWYVRTLKGLISNPVYIGSFQYGRNRNGQFYTTDEKGEVVELSAADAPGKVWKYANHFPAMVPVATFRKAQQRIAEFATGQRRAKRLHALTGILFCARCGQPLYGTKLGQNIVYRCSANQMTGSGTCEQWQVREDRILPFLMKLLAEEIGELRRLMSNPPRELTKPTRHSKERTQQRDKLATRIKNAMESLFDTSDKTTRKEIDKRISEMRQQLSELDAQNTEPQFNGRTMDELQALDRWWTEYWNKAVRFPAPDQLRKAILGTDKHYTAQYSPTMTLKEMDEKIDPVDGDPNFLENFQAYVMLDPLLVNEALLQIGTRVTLEWETVEYENKRLYKDRHGKRRSLPSRRHVLKRGRFQLGQKQGKLPSYVLKHSGLPSTCSCW